MELKRTPLFSMHQKYQGKMIDFGGWELPVQFAGILKEHHMVREKAGLFDVSHMGEIEIKGDKAEDLVDYLLSNNVKKMQEFQVQYNLMCYPNGGVVDDLLVYKYAYNYFLLVVNAANIQKDYEWIKEHAFPGVEVKDVSDRYAQLAVQGPRAQSILQKICKIDLNSIKYFWFDPQVKIAGVDCLLSRTGYTGEDGFEVYTAPGQAGYLWEQILQAGGDDIAPIGLGARDSLRMEAKLALYGQEIDRDITPLEADLANFVKLDKKDFIGREALLKQGEELSRILVEFTVLERGIARSHYQVEKDGENIGWVTTGSFSPTFGKNMGLALIKREHSAPGTEIDIIIRGKKVKARIDRGLFYNKKTRKS